MTTIAWDGKTLAGDKCGNAGGMSCPTTKIWRIHGSLFGFAGRSAGCVEARAWLEQGGKPEDMPEMQRHPEDGVHILRVDPDGGTWIYERGPIPFKLDRKFHAIGSGRDFAMAAMHLGRTAREAIEVASEFDINSGLGVDTLSFED